MDKGFAPQLSWHMKAYTLLALVALVVPGCVLGNDLPVTCLGDGCIDEAYDFEPGPDAGVSPEGDTGHRVDDNTPDGTVEPDAVVDRTDPCILVQEGGVEFGLVIEGQTSSKTVTFTNCSTAADLEVDRIVLRAAGDPQFTITALPGGLPTELLVVPPGGAATVVVTYTPTDEGTNEGTLEIRSNDPRQDLLVVPVRGHWTNTCPIPVALGRVQGAPWSDLVDAPVGAIVELNGAGSFDEEGVISFYDWEVILRPAGSNAQIDVLTRGVITPTFSPDVEGAYVVELQVRDTWGEAGCDPVRVTIQAFVAPDIRVELTWDTPGDPNQNDHGINQGTDLDLHLLNPHGSWNSVPWDCYLFNSGPNWGDPGSRDDDAHLLIDDTDGAGPEVIVLDQPEDRPYRIGVYYNSDHGFGLSYATVRVFVQGLLAFEYRDKLLEQSGQFWEVAAIDWSTGRVHQIDRVVDGFQ